MDEWSVVTVIISLVGLIVVVVKPLLSLNSSIVTLTEEVKGLNKGMIELNSKNTDDHKRIWGRIDKHNETLADHEKRIDHLETMEKL